MLDLLKSCRLCPRNCGVNRLKGEKGYCRAGKDIKAALASLHKWEEPCISGKNGSGTIFFSSCNLRCVFCQNYKISSNDFGTEISSEKLSEIFLNEQEKGANNINLVTPTHYVPQIIEAIDSAKSKGLSIPILYNSSGYEKVETIKALKGYIDVYLPDIKYFSDKYAVRYSNAPNYFKYASSAVLEMIDQVGKVQFDENGIIKKGVIVRHMMLPGLLFDSKKIMDFICRNIKDYVYVSIMNQYTPMFNAASFPEINKTLNPKHYDALIQYALDNGLEHGFIQESGTATKDFIPDFNLKGIL